jgi:tetratricopeptide (TPR) repeat protein
MVEQRRGKSTEAKAALERARDLYATAHNNRGMLVTTANMAAMSIQTNDLDSADTLLQESLLLERMVDDRRVRAFVYGLLGSLAFNQGAFDKSRDYLATAVEGLIPASEGQLWSEMLNSLAVVCALEGDVSEADRLVRSSLRTSIELDHHAGVIGSLEAAAQICLSEDQRESAEWYYASARCLREQLSYWSHSLLGSDALEARIEEALRHDGKALTKVLEWRAAAERLLDVGLQPSARTSRF